MKINDFYFYFYFFNLYTTFIFGLFFSFSEFITAHHSLLLLLLLLQTGQFLDLLSQEKISGDKKQWALGPFNPVTIRENKGSNDHQQRRHKCLEWLDKKPPNSVIYISFGTTCSFTDEQIKELAIGLEESHQSFIWVLREADRGNVFVEEEEEEAKRRSVGLPKGYEGRIEGKGLVVRDWAPQLEILGHPSIGGFMSHCGWNSCMESITMGVPILAWPIHSDQPRNTVLVTKLLGIGLVVKNCTHGDELVRANDVERAVRKLMGSREGDEIRMRAVELGEAVRVSASEGSRVELDSFIGHITR